MKKNLQNLSYVFAFIFLSFGVLVQAADNPEPYDSAVESMTYDELKEKKDELLKEKKNLKLIKKTHKVHHRIKLLKID